MRIHFPNRVEFPNEPFGFSHMLRVLNGLGVTAISDLWMNAHVWMGDQRLPVKDGKLLTQLGGVDIVGEPQLGGGEA